MEELTYEYMKDNIFSNVYGHDKLKDALMLLLVSKKPLRILIIGDPGSGKTQFLRDVAVASDRIFVNDFSEIRMPEDSKVICIDNFIFEPEKEELMYRRLFNPKNSILISVRPDYGRFDPYELITRQTTLPTRMLSEFDLYFP